MAQPNSYRDREYTSFVDSPTRPNKSAREVVSVISDQDGDILQINPDGSLNLSLSQATTKITYNEVNGVANGVTTNIITFTPTSNIKLIGIDVSGTNTAQYEVLHNANVINKKLTYFGNSLNEEFNMAGVVVLNGQTIAVDVTHQRPGNGNFNASIKYQEI